MTDDIIDKQELEKLKSISQMNKQLEYLVNALTSKNSNSILGNTRLKREEIDLLVINKEIGEQAHNNILNYYKKEKNYNTEQLSKIPKNILFRITDKNCLARWSIDSKSKEEIITLGIGTFKQESTNQMGESLLSKMPLVGRFFR